LLGELFDLGRVLLRLLHLGLHLGALEYLAKLIAPVATARIRIVFVSVIARPSVFLSLPIPTAPAARLARFASSSAALTGTTGTARTWRNSSACGDSPTIAESLTSRTASAWTTLTGELDAHLLKARPHALALGHHEVALRLLHLLNDHQDLLLLSRAQVDGFRDFRRNHSEWAENLEPDLVQALLLVGVEDFVDGCFRRLLNLGHGLTHLSEGVLLLSSVAPTSATAFIAVFPHSAKHLVSLLPPVLIDLTELLPLVVRKTDFFL
jgi:hypothetical protein